MSSQAIPRATSLADKTWGLDSLTQARFSFDRCVVPHVSELGVYVYTIPLAAPQAGRYRC
jgi:hypothetical protein